MSYVSRTLGNNEKILYSTGYHWLYWLGTAVLLTPFVAVAVGGLPYAGLDYLYLALAAIPFFYGVRYFIKGIALEVAVTTDRFVKKTGFISIKTEEVSLDKIEEVNIDESIVGRIFGYGNVQVHGTGAGDISVRMVADPVGLRRQIQTAREHVKNNRAE
jgi:uncharacterized membrane protein YdbT with pleckstrin-like domain